MMEKDIENIKEVEKIIYDWLLLLGFNPVFLGTKYICKTISILIFEEKEIECMEVYKRIANIRKKTINSVERAIRYCKEQNWQRIYKKYKRYISENNEKTPLSNWNFIILLAYLFKKEKGDKIEKI